MYVVPSAPVDLASDVLYGYSDHISDHFFVWLCWGGSQLSWTPYYMPKRLSVVGLFVLT